MWPDGAELGSVLVLLALLAVALPKRDWRTIPGRFRETRSGLRHYLFGPPDRTAALSSDRRMRTLQRLRGELRRAFELGIPLLAVAWYAETRGIEARRQRDAACRESKKGLLLRHLAGEITEEELHARLRQRNYVPPAPELVLPRSRPMPPMSWRLEWDRRLREMEAEADERWAEEPAPALAPAPQPPAPAAVAATVAPEPPAAHQGPVVPTDAALAGDTAGAGEPAAAVERPDRRIEIQTLGEIRIVIDGEDVAPELMHARTLAFMVLYLLAWDLRQPGGRVTREHLADETFRGQSPQARRTGVSQRLTNLKRRFPQLRSRIRTEGEYLSFDSAGCEIDVLWVLSVAEQVKTAAGALTGEQHDDARTALALAAREFMPGWESIESKGTLGGSAASDVIADVRDRVVAARLDILVALADAALARQQLDDAMSHLEEALGLRPERTALARKLADVYERNGHPQRAARLRGEYGLDQAS